MPELPEVEVVKQSLQKIVISKRILKVKVNNRNLRFKINKNFTKIVKNKNIINLYRRAKYLIFELENKNFILIHFGMSGTLHFIKKNKKRINTNLSFYSSRDIPKKHNHIEFFFINFKLVYNDPRRFGFFIFFSSKKKLDFYLNKIGPEPFEKKFNYKYLKKQINFKKRKIKDILLDQKIISGLGNIYVNEILFYSKINPLTLGKKLSDSKLKEIVRYSKFVIKKAINQGGSSIKNFKNSKGQTGNFQNEFRVYNREGISCPNKCNNLIKKIFVTNRSTFYCKKCQRN